MLSSFDAAALFCIWLGQSAHWERVHGQRVHPLALALTAEQTRMSERCRKQCPGRTMRIGGRLGGCEEQDCGLQQQQACQAERSRCPSGLHLAWAFTAGWLQPGDRACVQARLELRAARSQRQGWCDSRLCAERRRLQSVLGCNPGTIAAYSCEEGSLCVPPGGSRVS